MKHWIGVVSKDHVKRGVQLGIAQIGHGKRPGLRRKKAGDWLIYYSPRESLTGGAPLQAFTAIGKVADDDIWQEDEGDFNSVTLGLPPARQTGDMRFGAASSRLPDKTLKSSQWR